MKPDLPEDLQALLKRVVHLQRHLKTHPKDLSNHRGLNLMEARIRRLARDHRAAEDAPRELELHGGDRGAPGGVMPSGPESFVADPAYSTEFTHARELLLGHPGRWRIVYHYDGDGIASASAAVRALQRLGYGYQATPAPGGRARAGCRRSSRGPTARSSSSTPGRAGSTSTRPTRTP